MDLFELRNGFVIPSVHALMIEPFKSMWETDYSDGKEMTLKEFAYIEFMCSPKKTNPYFGYTDMDMREKAVKKEVYKDENYHTNTDMLTGIWKYIELLKDESPSYGLLEDAIAGAEKTRKWCRDFEPSEKTPNGALLLKPRDITAALNEIPNTVKKLEETRKQVISELNETSKTRKDREVNHFEK